MCSSDLPITTLATKIALASEHWLYAPPPAARSASALRWPAPATTWCCSQHDLDGACAGMGSSLLIAAGGKAKVAAATAKRRPELGVAASGPDFAARDFGACDFWGQ